MPLPSFPPFHGSRTRLLNPHGTTQRGLTDAIGARYQLINEIVNGRRGVARSTALGAPLLRKVLRVPVGGPDRWSLSRTLPSGGEQDRIRRHPRAM